MSVCYLKYRFCVWFSSGRLFCSGCIRAQALRYTSVLSFSLLVRVNYNSYITVSSCWHSKVCRHQRNHFRTVSLFLGWFCFQHLSENSDTVLWQKKFIRDCGDKELSACDHIDWNQRRWQSGFGLRSLQRWITSKLYINKMSMHSFALPLCCERAANSRVTLEETFTLCYPQRHSLCLPDIRAMLKQHGLQRPQCLLGKVKVSVIKQHVYNLEGKWVKMNLWVVCKRITARCKERSAKCWISSCGSSSVCGVLHLSRALTLTGGAWPASMERRQGGGVGFLVCLHRAQSSLQVGTTDNMWPGCCGSPCRKQMMIQGGRSCFHPAGLLSFWARLRIQFRKCTL